MDEKVKEGIILLTREKRASKKTARNMRLLTFDTETGGGGRRKKRKQTNTREGEKNQGEKTNGKNLALSAWTGV